MQPLHGGLLIHSHTHTSKRKSNKKKIRCGGDRLRAGEGGKGGAKERPLRGLKEKVTSPFSPSLWGMEMMENPTGLPHSHTPPHTPNSLPTFSCLRKKLSLFF